MPSISCPNNSIGTQCQNSMDPCVFQNPCQNGGTCRSDTQLGYVCECLPGYEGDQCQLDQTLCRTKCFGRGNCTEIDNGTDFQCQCEAGWIGQQCERMIDNCVNVICENRGVCVNLLLNYTCSCLQPYFSGRHCEIASTKMKMFAAVSTSFGYIAWISLGIIVGFIVTMDVLKYAFGIDPVESERQRMKHEKMNKKKNAIRRRYVQKKEAQQKKTTGEQTQNVEQGEQMV